MWDAPEPYPGYAKDKYGRDDKRVVYPATKGEAHPLKVNCIRVHLPSTSQYMHHDEQYLRLPTQEELDTLEWPQIK